MNQKRLIFFLEPLLFPAGGQAAIYRHVEILRAHGIAAFVATRKKPRVDFYKTNAPLLIYGSRFLRLNYGNGFLRNWQLRRKVRPGDVWVIPETCPDILRVLKNTPAKLILFCQNHFFLRFGHDPTTGIPEFGADKIVASAKSIRDFFRDVYDLDVPFLQTYAIDDRIFSPSVKKRQIAFMPRKLPKKAVFIQAVFKRRHPKFADVPWVSVDGVPQVQVGRVLGESAVFLSLSSLRFVGITAARSHELRVFGCRISR